MQRTQKGFSLIEAMIAFVVLSVGLLAIASFQSNLFSESGSNKAKSEALAIAQARLDEFRNYSSTVSDQTDFNTTFTAETVQNDGADIPGTNATFTKGYTITGGDNEAKTIQVMVSWDDSSGDEQSVSLSTKVVFQSPRAVGDLANNDPTPLVDSATGRARLGDGTLNTDGKSPISSNGDGTTSYNDDGDHKLTIGTPDDNDDVQVVLTLNDACSSDTECTDFVKIKGRVYIDTTSQRQLQPGDVFIKASDAAYCHRYYLNALDGSETADVTNATTTSETPNTANGDYEVMEYTCYLGGGWHGNIGVLLTGGISQSDKICQGDPTSENSWEQPVIAARRVYRGMLYQKDNNGSPATDDDGQIIYASVGVQDGITLPDPDTSNKPHDFVIGSMAASDVEGSKCIVDGNQDGPMMQADSNENGSQGDRFAGMPDDFFCLNGPDGEGNPNGYINYPESSTYPAAAYGANITCPYDPSDPPVASMTIDGTLTVTADADLESLVNAVTIESTDGPGSCTLDTDNYAYTDGDHTIDYSCDYYLWSNSSTWSGSVILSANTDEFSCSPIQRDYSNLTASQTDQDFSCATGTPLTIEGVITVEADSGMSETVDGISLATSDSVACTRSDFNYASNIHSATYSCDVVDLGSGWSGTVDLSLNTSDLSCTSNQISFSSITAPQSSQDFSCSTVAPPQTIVISGSIATAGTKELATAVISDAGGSCEVPDDGLSYTCTSGAFTGTWSGTITFTADNGGNLCVNGTSNSNATETKSYSGLSSDTSDNSIAVISGSNSCP